MLDSKRIKGTEALQENFRNKIEYLRVQVKNAREQDLNSNIRAEYCNNIAVTLRAMLCYSSGPSLAKRTKYGKEIIFPLRNNNIALNLLPSYTLVVCKLTDSLGTIEVSDIVEDKHIHAVYMSFEKWLNEIVIDFKTPDCAPASRNKIIKVVADKLGAHVDNTIDEYLYKIQAENIFPITVIDEKNETIETTGANLFSETILGIAEELIYAFDFTYQSKLKLRGISESHLYVQTYNNAKNEQSYKFLVIKSAGNAYNSNRYFHCTVEEKLLHSYYLKYKHMNFIVEVIE